MKMRAMTRLSAVALVAALVSGVTGCALPGQRGGEKISEQEVSILAVAIESVVSGKEDISLLYYAGGTAHDLEFGAPEGREEVQAIAWKLDQHLSSVLNAVRSRQRRYVTIQQYIANGCLGESRKGLLIGPHVHHQPCPDVDKNKNLDNRLAVLVNWENDDRRAIYDGIVRHSAVSGRATKTVRRVFTEVRRDHALPGTLLQLDSGEWVPKGQ